jgi:hypothetical protein
MDIKHQNLQVYVLGFFKLFVVHRYNWIFFLLIHKKGFEVWGCILFEISSQFLSQVYHILSKIDIASNFGKH